MMIRMLVKTYLKIDKNEKLLETVESKCFFKNIFVFKVETNGRTPCLAIDLIHQRDVILCDTTDIIGQFALFAMEIVSVEFILFKCQSKVKFSKQRTLKKYLSWKLFPRFF